MPGLPARHKPRPKAPTSFFASSGYIDDVVRRVCDLVRRGQVVSLVAPLGAGKSDALRAVFERVNNIRGWKAIRIDMGRDEPPRNASEFWQDVAFVRSEGIETAVTDPRDTPYLREWALCGPDSIALLVDHVELVDEDWLLTELREAVQRNTGDRDGENGRLITVVAASTDTLAYRLFSPTSPFHGISTRVPMADCRRAMRRRFWAARLRPVKAPAAGTLIDALDALCAGDPYLIDAMSSFLTTQVGTHLSAARVDDAIRAAHANPARVAPLLRRYGELVEAEPIIFDLALKLLDPETVVPVAELSESSLDGTPFWRGVFANDGAVWSFRAGLTRRFFEQEFAGRPERVAAAHTRHGEHRRAVQTLTPRRNRFRHGQDALVAAITAWIKSAASPSQAWQNVASALSLVFGPQTRVIRYAPFRVHRTDPDAHFYEVRLGTLERPADRDLATALLGIHNDRVDSAPMGAICLRPAADAWHDSAGAPMVVFSLSRQASPFGAVLLPTASYEPSASVKAPAMRDHDERWQKALSVIFQDIVDFEAQAVGGAELGRAERAAQAALTSEGPEISRWLTLTAVTGGFGLRFNRAVLLRAATGRRLVGVDGIGQHSQAETESGWKQAPQTFEHTLALVRLTERGVRGAPPVSALTPIRAEVVDFALDDWRPDPMLGPALLDGGITVCDSQTLALSALGGLMRIEGEARRQDNPVLIAPLREGERLLGALVVDKPFAAEAVTQEQFDALPALAFQLTQLLRAEEEMHRRAMFDEISLLAASKMSYQKAAESVAGIVLAALNPLLSRVVISTWETDSEPGALDRRQVTVRVVRDASGNDLLGGRPIYAYLSDRNECWGPVHDALKRGRVDTDDGSGWCDRHGYTPSSVFDESEDAILSLPMGRRAGQMPRGVISFQAPMSLKFNSRDRELFERIATRAGNILDKARQYESLERSRHLTEQLNEALIRLVEPATDEALYAAMLDQLTAFFRRDAYDLDRERYSDSAALFAISGSRLDKVVAGRNPELSQAIARGCPNVRDGALADRTAYVEYAERELLGREKYGEGDCATHHQAGAQASVWCAIGDGLLLVLAWRTPRRFSSSERRNLPLLTMIAERTNVLINAERQRLQAQLANSLRLEDYELIEAEQTHQWNRRLRAIRNSAHWAMEMLKPATGQKEVAEALEQLDDLDKEAGEAQDRLIYGRFKHVEQIQIGDWIRERVVDWQSIHRNAERVQVAVASGANQPVLTRPVVLRWILHELLTNAEEAERRSPTPRILIEVNADPMTHDALVTVENATPLPRATLDTLANKTPPLNLVDIGRGRGLWIGVRQVRTLLGGMLEFPESGAKSARITLRLPKTLID